MSYLAVFLELVETNWFVASLCMVGVLICLYAIKVETVGFSEKKAYGKPQYRQICDVNESMSCTLVLTSKYSHMVKLIFGLTDKSIFNYSNAQYGFAIYVGLLVVQFYPFTLLPYYDLVFLIVTGSSVLASMGLAWILYSVLHNFCLICFCMYMVNGLMFTSAIMRML